MGKAFAEFRDGPWSDRDRTLMGAEQEAWLHAGLTRSVKAGTRWQILVQQVVMGSVRAPEAIADWTSVNAPQEARKVLKGIAAASKAGLPLNLDAWDGYPAARDRLLHAALESGSNLVVLSGDSHNAWGNNLTLEGRAVGVEYAGHAVTSPGFEAYFPSVGPADVARSLRETNPGLVYSDTSRRGYVSLQVFPDRVHGQWHYVPTIAERTIAGVESEGLGVRWSERRFASA